MKFGYFGKIGAIVALSIILLKLPSCCWNRPLKRCKSCNDCGVIHEKQKIRQVITGQEGDVITLGDVVENN